MGGVCCANEREKTEKNYQEMSTTNKVRITFQSRNDFTNASTNDLDYNQYYEDEEPATTGRASFRQKAQLRRYKTIRGDHVDEIVGRIVFELDVQMPIVRVMQGRYNKNMHQQQIDFTLSDWN